MVIVDLFNMCLNLDNNQNNSVYNSITTLSKNFDTTYLQVSTSLFGEDVELVDVQRVLRDCRTLSDRRPAVLHEGEEPIQEHPSIRILVHLVQPSQSFGTLRALRGWDKTSIDDKNNDVDEIKTTSDMKDRKESTKQNCLTRITSRQS